MKYRRGFSFIELIMYIAIVAVFVSGAILFGVNVTEGRIKGNVQQEVADNLRLAVARISFEIRNASSITSVTAGTLTLANTDATRNPTVIGTSGGRIYVQFGSSGTCSVAGACPITGNLVTSTLAFTNLTNIATTTKNVRFTVTVASGGGAGVRSEFARTESFTSTAEVRSN